MGLSLSGTGAFDTYSIDIRFDFNSVNASFNGYQRILDFRNRASDSGLYSLNGYLQLFASSSSPGDPSATSTAQVFTNGTIADLLVMRDSTGLFSAYVNGFLAFSVMDSDSSTTFSGPNNIMYFFIDDLQSLATHPTQLEAGSGFVDSITVQVFSSAVPEPSTWAMMLIGFCGLGFAFRQSWRKVSLA
jgi:PEP-CTERM motif